VIPWFARELGAPSAAVTFRAWIENPSITPLEEHHARHAAQGPARTAQDARDGAVVGRLDGAPVLLDGYHRAVQFWCSNEPAAKLPVYVPE
jgi:hypothetical protein